MRRTRINHGASDRWSTAPTRALDSRANHTAAGRVAIKNFAARTHALWNTRPAIATIIVTPHSDIFAPARIKFQQKMWIFLCNWSENFGWDLTAWMWILMNNIRFPYIYNVEKIGFHLFFYIVWIYFHFFICSCRTSQIPRRLNIKSPLIQFNHLLHYNS